jgi:hypothetical protein
MQLEKVKPCRSCSQGRGSSPGHSRHKLNPTESVLYDCAIQEASIELQEACTGKRSVPITCLMYAGTCRDPKQLSLFCKGSLSCSRAVQCSCGIHCTS